MSRKLWKIVMFYFHFAYALIQLTLRFVARQPYYCCPSSYAA